MPFTIITIKNAPQSLRGDLTKWMQEIATGVYVGNFNTRVREELWKRVVQSAGVGEATLSFTCKNEIGYNFETHNTLRTVIDYDGIPLVVLNKQGDNQVLEENKKGFSDAKKFRNAKIFSYKKDLIEPYVVIDIETDGLDEKKNNIIEVGALKYLYGKKERYQSFIKYERKLPDEIVKLTGIYEEMLINGKELSQVLRELKDFIGDWHIVGYGVDFDLKFLNQAFVSVGLDKLKNKAYDLRTFVKREKKFLDNYKLETVLTSYGINEIVPHRALEDAKLIYQLSKKVNKFQEKIIKE